MVLVSAAEMSPVASLFTLSKRMPRSNVSRGPAVQWSCT